MQCEELGQQSSEQSLYEIILIAGSEKVNRKGEARPVHKAAYEDEVAELERVREHARKHKQRPDHDRFSHSLGFGALSLHRRPSTFLYQGSLSHIWSVSSQATCEPSRLSKHALLRGCSTVLHDNDYLFWVSSKLSCW